MRDHGIAWLNTKQENVPRDIVELWQTADSVWEENQELNAFCSYVSANYLEVFDALESEFQKLHGQDAKFLEFGSGLGIATIMASRIGFDAYGIEAKEDLVDYARQFAEQFAPSAQFATGSFIPDAYQWNPAGGDESERTFIDEPEAYGEFGLDLCDFDLLYAYPWPTEHGLYDNVVEQFARPGARYLTFDAHEGIKVRTM